MSGFDGKPSHKCKDCGRGYVYSDSLERHRAVCSTRLRVNIRALVSLIESMGGRRMEMWPIPESLTEADAILKDDGKGANMSDKLRHLKPPFRADPMGGYIFSANGLMVCQVRGWGQLQRQADGAECQDAHLQFIADALNEKCEREGIK